MKKLSVLKSFGAVKDLLTCSDLHSKLTHYSESIISERFAKGDAVVIRSPAKLSVKNSDGGLLFSFTNPNVGTIEPEYLIVLDTQGYVNIVRDFPFNVNDCVVGVVSDRYWFIFDEPVRFSIDSQIEGDVEHLLDLLRECLKQDETDDFGS